MKKIESVLAIFKEKKVFCELLSLLGDEGYRIKHLQDLGIKKLDANFQILIVDLDSKKIKKNLIKFSELHNSNAYVFGITSQNATMPSFENFRIIRTPLIFNEFLENVKKVLDEKKFKFELIQLDEFVFSSQKSILVNKKKEFQINLTELENKFLSYLVEKRDGATKSDILKNVWGHNSQLNTHTLESLIYRLRRKIEKDPNKPKLLIQIKKKYFMNCEAKN